MTKTVVNEKIPANLSRFQWNDGLIITPVKKYGKNTNVRDKEHTRPIQGRNPPRQPTMIVHIKIKNFHLPLQNLSQSHAKQSHIL
jgi:hypothetical protein